MKLKQVETILKQEKTIIVAETQNCQWLSNGSAFYPIQGLPKLTKQNIFTLFDIAEDKREKFYFEERSLPAQLNFEDIDSTEQMLDRGTITFYADGQALEPIKSSQGIVFINDRYLKPFADEVNGYELYERTDKNGNIYIVVKTGFILLGIIAPYDLISEKFIETLENILELSRVTWYNKAKKHRNSTDKINMGDDGKCEEEKKK